MRGVLNDHHLVSWPNGYTYGAGDCRFESCRDHLALVQEIHLRRTSQVLTRSRGCGTMFNLQRFYLVECVDSSVGVPRRSWEHLLEPGGCSCHTSWIQDVICCWPYPCAGKNASAPSRTRVTPMAMMDVFDH